MDTNQPVPATTYFMLKMQMDHWYICSGKRNPPPSTRGPIHSRRPTGIRRKSTPPLTKFLNARFISICHRRIINDRWIGVHLDFFLIATIVLLNVEKTSVLFIRRIYSHLNTRTLLVIYLRDFEFVYHKKNANYLPKIYMCFTRTENRAPNVMKVVKQDFMRI